MYFSVNVVPLTDRGRLPRPLKLLLNCLRHPLQTLRQLNPVGKTAQQCPAHDHAECGCVRACEVAQGLDEAASAAA